MPKFLSKEEAFAKCKREGSIIVIAGVNIDKIQSCLSIALEDFESAKDDLAKRRWNSGYKMHYDVLHELVEAFLLFDKVKSLNHQCLFSYVCEKHPELELSWDFFETIRTKRNGINYYQTPVDENDWKEMGLQFNLYIKTLTNEVRKKICEWLSL